MQVDLELALIEPATVNFKILQELLPSDFYAEDRSEKGWGFVIRTTRELSDDAGAALDSFLPPLRPLTDTIKKAAAVLRIGAFCDTVTCTIRIGSCIDLAAMEISLEISLPVVPDPVRWAV